MSSHTSTGVPDPHPAAPRREPSAPTDDRRRDGRSDGSDWDGPEPPAARLSVTSTTPAGPVRVHVWPAGENSARRPVLLGCHDWTESGLAFGPLARALGHRWTVVAADAPGHGGSPWFRDRRYRVAEHSRGALAILDQLPEVAGRRAAVVALGHGLGALTASRLAAARPNVVRQLVLEDPVRVALRRVQSAAAVRRRIVALQQLEPGELTRNARREWPTWPQDEIDVWAESTKDASPDALSVPVDWGEPLVALLADVPCPVTLVHGTLARGGMVSAVGARRCADACRGGAEVVHLDAGHHPRREAREPFMAVLAAILGRLNH